MSLATLSKASPAASSRLRPNRAISSKAVHPVEVGVAAGDHQGHEGERRRGFRQKRRHDVGLQMVDAHQGFL